MKKQFNCRLEETTIAVIKGEARIGGCSEAEVIERWAVGKQTASDVGQRANPGVQVGHHSLVGGVAPKGSFSLADLKALVAKKPDTDVKPEGPEYPFDVSIGGEPHMVVLVPRRGPHLGYKTPDGEVVNLRSISEEKALEYWEARK